MADKKFYAKVALTFEVTVEFMADEDLSDGDLDDIAFDRAYCAYKETDTFVGYDVLELDLA